MMKSWDRLAQIAGIGDVMHVPIAIESGPPRSRTSLPPTSRVRRAVVEAGANSLPTELFCSIEWRIVEVMADLLRPSGVTSADAVAHEAVVEAIAARDPPRATVTVRVPGAAGGGDGCAASRVG